MHLAFFIITLLFTISASAQTNLLTTESFYDWNGDSFDNLPYKEITYEYDVNDVLIQEVEFINIDTILGLDVNKITTYYPETELVKSIFEKGRYGANDRLVEFEYSNDSCLLSEKFYSYQETEQLFYNYRNNYYDPMTCRIDSMVRFNVFGADVRNYIYEYGNDSVKIYSYPNTSDSLSYLFSYEIYGTSNELLLQIVSTDIIDKYEYSYNEYGDLERKAYSYKGGVNNAFRLTDETLYTYDYGMDGEKYSEIENQINYYHSGALDTFTYTHYFEFPIEETFYCDGLLKSTLYQINKEGDYENSTLKKYAYAFGENCNNSTMTANIFPNPSKGILHIQSELLETAGASIGIVALTGSPVLSIEVPERISTFDLDLSELPSGVYVLQLTSHESTINKKIHIVD